MRTNHHLVDRRSAVRRPLLISLVVLSCILLAYTAARAALLSMTHDESTTFWLRDVRVLSCFFSADCWGSANLHLLNTWLMKRSEAWFGASELALRLPNLLAHVLFLGSSVRLLLLFHRPFLVSLAGFLLINANPYVLDFFSLARGYGLCMGLSLASITALFSFLQRESRSALLLSYAFAFLAVMANFVALNYLASLWAAVFILSLLRPGRGRVKIVFTWRRQRWMNAIPLSVAVVLAILLYVPIQHLRGAGEFAYGARRFGETFTALVSHSLYGVNYFSKDTGAILGSAYWVLLSASLIGAFWFFFKKPEEYWRRCYLAVALLFLLSCLAMIGQHYLLGSNYLLDRKSLHFFLLSGLLFHFLLAGLTGLWGARFGTVAGALISLSIVYHLGRVANLDYCREWWYDRHTREMVTYLDALPLADGAPVQLGVAWAFQPSTSFYLHRRNMSRFVTPPMDSGIQTDGRYDFYYVFGGDYEQLKDQYEVERQFPAGTYLLRRKDFGK